MNSLLKKAEEMTEQKNYRVIFFFLCVDGFESRILSLLTYLTLGCSCSLQ